MKKFGMLILALILIYIILITSVADINHGQGPVGLYQLYEIARIVGY